MNGTKTMFLTYFDLIWTALDSFTFRWTNWMSNLNGECIQIGLLAYDWTSSTNATLPRAFTNYLSSWLTFSLWNGIWNEPTEANYLSLILCYIILVFSYCTLASQYHIPLQLEIVSLEMNASLEKSERRTIKNVFRMWIRWSISTDNG